MLRHGSACQASFVSPSSFVLSLGLDHWFLVLCRWFFVVVGSVF